MSDKPIRPADEHCQILWDWLEAIEVRAKDDDAPVEFKQISEIAPKLRLAIQKSSYLNRRLYGNDAHRTEKCPLHKGQWSGLPMSKYDCPHGCDLTGWLPVKEDKDGQAGADQSN